MIFFVALLVALVAFLLAVLALLDTTSKLSCISCRTTSLALSISSIIVDAVELTLLFTLLNPDAPVFDFLPLLAIMWSLSDWGTSTESMMHKAYS